MPSNTLDYITIKGFKSIAAVEELVLRPINIVIGANGSGKSNFLGVFSFLHAIREGRLENYVTEAGGAEKILHFGSKTTSEIEVVLSFRDESERYELILSPTSEDGLFPSIEVTYPPGNTFLNGINLQARQRGREASISDPQSEGIASRIREHLRLWRVYHLDDTSPSSGMRKTARVNDNRFLRPNGSNLPSFLYLLRKRDKDSYSSIVRAVQQVAPFFDDFRLDPLELNPDDFKLEWRHKT